MAANNLQPEAVAKSGWLLRLSDTLHRWKRSWFVLYASGKLMYYSNDSVAAASDFIHIPRQRVVFLDPSMCTAVTAPYGGSPDLVFGIRTSLGRDDRFWCLAAVDEDDLAAWKAAIEEAQKLPVLVEFPPQPQQAPAAAQSRGGGGRGHGGGRGGGRGGGGGRGRGRGRQQQQQQQQQSWPPQQPQQQWQQQPQQPQQQWQQQPQQPKQQWPSQLPVAQPQQQLKPAPPPPPAEPQYTSGKQMLEGYTGARIFLPEGSSVIIVDNEMVVIDKQGHQVLTGLSQKVTTDDKEEAKENGEETPKAQESHNTSTSTSESNQSTENHGDTSLKEILSHTDENETLVDI